MTEAASLSARLVSSPLALLSWEVYVLRHISCLKCFLFVSFVSRFSSRVARSLSYARFKSGIAFIRSICFSFSFLLFSSIPRDRPIVFFFSVNQWKIYEWNRCPKLLQNLTTNNLYIHSVRRRKAMAQKWHLLTTLTFKNLMLKLAINIDRLYRCVFFFFFSL